MKFALINPNWTFDGSIYFGCREPHLPLEYGYSKALLESVGHEVLLVDGHMENLSLDEIRERVKDFKPSFTVITTAPSYLFWRCAPPELRVPQAVVRAVKEVGGVLVAVGPHGSTTPRAILKKLEVDIVVLGECEEILPKLTTIGRETLPIAYKSNDGQIHIQGVPHASALDKMPALRWSQEFIQRHHHHHHRFDIEPKGLGAEMEASRGCPYHCSFCAKENFRNGYRKRPLAIILEELDNFISQGVEYIYFIDEIFLPNRVLLESLATRPIKFGIQTRIDLWTPTLLELLGSAGCVSIEAGIESISEEGREQLDKNCKLSTTKLSELLIEAKQYVPFVQANLLASEFDDPNIIEAWRQHLQEFGVWANKPVPLFPYPGSPNYTQRWGFPDDQAWERASEYYLQQHSSFSDIQDSQPLPLQELECCEKS
jgi:B12-binding domain/radical SAM domain protein of rhizo-twelve system